MHLMMMNFTWKQAETLSPGQLAIEGIQLATKTWGQFLKFVIATALGGLAIVILVGIWNMIGLPLGGLISTLAFAVFSLAVGVGAVRLSLAVVDGKKLSLKELYTLDSKLVGSIIVAAIVYSIAVTIGTLALIVPGIMIALGCSFTMYTLVDKKDIGPIQALKASWAITNGDLLNIALLSSAIGFIYYLALLPAYEVGAVLFGILTFLAAIKLKILIIFPALGLIALAAIVICAAILVMIGGALSYALAYRKLTHTRASAMEAAMKE